MSGAARVCLGAVEEEEPGIELSIFQLKGYLLSYSSCTLRDKWTHCVLLSVSCHMHFRLANVLNRQVPANHHNESIGTFEPVYLDDLGVVVTFKCTVTSLYMSIS